MTANGVLLTSILSTHAKTTTAPKYPYNPQLLSKIIFYQGDITKLETQVIVNAANKTLLGGGGVDGAIHRAAGPRLLQECKLLNGCQTGSAKMTNAYNLPCQKIIHTVGPIGEKPALLASCYRNSLDLMRAQGYRRIAFPCISTGVYGYPNESAAHVVLDTVRNWLDEYHEDVDEIVFCMFLDIDVDIYHSISWEYFGSS